MTEPVHSKRLAEARKVLGERFGFEGFRHGQEAVLEAVLAGKDCLAVLPTGAGKSLCYQLPALMGSGITLVVSPLIALMKDQVDGLVERGVAATFINSTLSADERSERLAAMRAGRYDLVYVAPERFRSPRFVASLASITIDLFAVDEAHCISMWGHDFRPDYQRLAEALERLGHPQTLALTATATAEVREDIVRQLRFEREGRKGEILVRGFARPGLTLAVSRCGGRADKLARLMRILEDAPTGIVYCATRKNVERLSDDFKRRRVPHVAYHGGMGDAARRQAQEAFLSGKKPVAVATNAFGMGIDRADLRFIVHWDVPGSLEAYYQEAGRAGRDGRPARCEILFNAGDVRTQQFFIEGANPPPDLVRKVAAVLRGACAEGPFEATEKELAAMVGARTNGMAVGTALGLLVRAGMVSRLGGRGGAIVLEDPEADLGPVLQGAVAKERLDRARLRHMLGYVESRGCRHGAMLGYFGDPEAPESCEACDNCLRGSEADGREMIELAGPELDRALAALGLVRAVDGRFGRGRIAQALSGSRDRGLLLARLDELDGYGALSAMAQTAVRRLVDALIQEDYLATGGGEYPTLHLTENGRAVLRGEAPLRMPARERRTAVGPPGRRSSTRLGTVMKASLGPGADPARGRGQGGAGAEGAPGGPGAGGAPSASVLGELKAFRSRVAKKRRVPAYRILHDATLTEIARLLPESLDVLGEVKGIGPKTLKKYGAEILGIVAGHVRRD